MSFDNPRGGGGDAGADVRRADHLRLAAGAEDALLEPDRQRANAGGFAFSRSNSEKISPRNTQNTRKIRSVLIESGKSYPSCLQLVRLQTETG
jgi:hypothetical protein